MINVAFNLLMLFYNFTIWSRNYCKRRDLRKIREAIKAMNEEKVSQIENITRIILSNPKIYDPNYIMTIEEEQALA